MLHILSGAMFVSILMISVGAIVATVRAEMASIRRVLGMASAVDHTPPAYRPRARVVRRAEFRPAQPLQARAA